MCTLKWCYLSTLQLWPVCIKHLLQICSHVQINALSANLCQFFHWCISIYAYIDIHHYSISITLIYYEWKNIYTKQRYTKIYWEHCTLKLPRLAQHNHFCYSNLNIILNFFHDHQSSIIFISQSTVTMTHLQPINCVVPAFQANS